MRGVPGSTGIGGGGGYGPKTLAMYLPLRTLTEKRNWKPNRKELIDPQSGELPVFAKLKGKKLGCFRMRVSRFKFCYFVLSEGGGITCRIRGG